jgi:hypothetical protein
MHFGGSAGLQACEKLALTGGLQSLCGKGQKSISTSLFDFQFCWSDAVCAILQKIQAVEIEVATQALQPREVASDFAFDFLGAPSRLVRVGLCNERSARKHAPISPPVQFPEIRLSYLRLRGVRRCGNSNSSS